MKVLGCKVGTFRRVVFAGVVGVLIGVAGISLVDAETGSQCVLHQEEEQTVVLLSDPSRDNFFELIERASSCDHLPEKFMEEIHASLGTWPNDLRVLEKRHVEQVMDGELELIHSLVRTLDLSNSDVESNFLHQMVSSSELEPLLQEIRILDLSHNHRVGPEGIDALATSKGFPNLHALRLRNVGLGSSDFLRLLQVENFSSVSELDLQSNRISNDGLRALNSIDVELKSVRELNISFNVFNIDFFVEMLNKVNFPELERLQVDQLLFNPAQFHQVSFGNARQLATVKHLEIKGSSLTNQMVASMAKTPFLSELRVLILEGNLLGCRSVEHIKSSVFAENLVKLNLADNGLAACPLSEFVRGGGLDSLQYLDLSGSRMADGTPVDDILFDRWKGMKELRLGMTNLSSEVVGALAESHVAGTLEVLDISGNGLGEDGIRKLLSGNRWTSLRELRLSSNQLGDSGTRRLGEGRGNFPDKMDVVSLSFNEIGDQGAAALAKSGWIHEGVSLRLRGNNVGEEGGEVLIRAAAGIDDVEIDLRWNEHSDDTIEFLRDVASKNEVNIRLQRRSTVDTRPSPPELILP